ncbi:MAG: TonB-dependent siderophore receptor, partial [Verrucomicrobium sp.]
MAVLPLAGFAIEPQTPASSSTAAAESPTTASQATISPGTTPATTQELETVTVSATALPPIATIPATTSTGLALTIRETPQAVTIVDRQRIEQEGFTNIAEVLADTPGITVLNLDTERTQYYARGFPITQFQVDGMPFFTGANESWGATPVYDTAFYESIDILRGANGLLTGPGYPSATINLNRKRPGRELAGSIAATIGTWEYYRGEGDVTIPITKDGRVRSRFVGFYQERNSYLDQYSEEQFGLYGIVEADLTEDTTFTVGYQYQKSDPRGASWGAVPYWTADMKPANLPRSTNWAADWSRWTKETGTIFTMLEQKLGEDWSLRAAYSHTEGSTDNVVGYAGGGFPDLTTGTGMSWWFANTYMEETRDNADLHLSGSFELFGRKHQVATGLQYNRFEETPVWTNSMSSYPSDIPNVWKLDRNPTEPKIGIPSADRYVEQYGGYASLRFSLADPLSLIVGARFSNWETYTDNYDTNGKHLYNNNEFRVSGEFTPYAGLVWDVTDNTSLYVSYTDIFQPQMGRDINGNIIEPIRGSNVEAGIKADFFEKRLIATFSVFETEQDNFYISDWSSPFPDGSYPSIPTGPITSQGFELELAGRITDDWTINAGYTHVSTKDDFGARANSSSPIDLVRLSTNYRLPGKLSKLSLGGGMSWQSDTNNSYWGSDASLNFEQNGFFLFDLNAQYRITENVV